MEMNANAVVEKARQVFDIEIEGLAAVRDQLGDGFVGIAGRVAHRRALFPGGVQIRNADTPVDTMADSSVAARMAPMTWNTMYMPQSLAFMRPVRN